MYHISTMPTSDAAKKSIRQNERRRKENQKKKDKMKELTKKVRSLADEGKQDEAKELLPELHKAIDKAAKTNVIKKNAAARKKSKMARYVKES